MLENAKWIIHPNNKQYEAISFKRELNISKKVKRATLNITALGVYCAEIDGVRVGDFILAPGFTSRKRVQYQEYDITKILKSENKLEITVGRSEEHTSELQSLG